MSFSIAHIQKENLSIPISCIPNYIVAILDNQVNYFVDIGTTKNRMTETYNLKKSQSVAA